MSIKMEEQYDKLYRYCYFKLHHQELAEDITQEAFLRYYEKYRGEENTSALKYLYTIARNLCIDEYRKPQTESIDEFLPEVEMEEQMIKRLSVRTALAKLDDTERELLLLRFVNEIPVSVIGGLLGISRFAVHRKLLSAKNKFQKAWNEEDEE